MPPILGTPTPCPSDGPLGSGEGLLLFDGPLGSGGRPIVLPFLTPPLIVTPQAPALTIVTRSGEEDWLGRRPCDGWCFGSWLLVPARLELCSRALSWLPPTCDVGSGEGDWVGRWLCGCGSTSWMLASGGLGICGCWWVASWVLVPGSLEPCGCWCVPSWLLAQGRSGSCTGAVLD